MPVGEIITCPSGLSGRLRGMKVREEKILADRKLARNGAQLDELLAACWEETLDPGPYKFEGPKPNWTQVLQGDRFYALLQLRAITYGPEYSFAVTCREPKCRSRIDWEVNLCDLPVRPLWGTNLDAFVAGNRFSTALPDAKKTVSFRLLVGADERQLVRLKRDAVDTFLAASIAFRLLDIDGVSPKDKRRFVNDLSLADARHLGEEFQRADCGVETSFEVECQSCFATQEVELPFETDFFLPTKGRFSRTSISRGGAKAPSTSSGSSTEDPASA